MNNHLYYVGLVAWWFEVCFALTNRRLVWTHGGTQGFLNRDYFEVYTMDERKCKMGSDLFWFDLN